MAPSPASPIPRIAPGAHFVPTHLLAGRPHVAVDCGRAPGTVLALSHWPGAGTPAGLAADTSAEIAARYLAATPTGPQVSLLTCDHYDEDGLLALWLLLEQPAGDDPTLPLALAAAEAGDFATWTDPQAARVAIAAMRMAERASSPFPDVLRVLSTVRDRDPAGDLYLAILPRVRRLLEEPDRFRLLWAADWQQICADSDLLDTGAATIEEVPAASLAIVRAPRRLHDMAVHPRTEMMRVLHVLPDRTMILRHRYETWVDYVSRPLAPRVDLAPLLPTLQALEECPGRWSADAMRAVRPNLFLRGDRGGPAPSSIDPWRLADELSTYLRAASPGEGR